MIFAEKIIVSIIIVARNEGEYLGMLLQDFLSQKFPPDQMELILVDGESTDHTRDIMENFLNANPSRKIRRYSNPRKILSAGLNIALSKAQGLIILRVDAHARIPSDFVDKNVQRIEKGESICGGYLQTLKPIGCWSYLIYSVNDSKFGGSLASYRNPGDARYVDTVAYAAYKRDVFAKIGGYDERLVRTEDNEIHYRMQKAGYKFFYDPEIHSEYISRNSLQKLIKQKYGNGFWIGVTLGISPLCFRSRHLIPSIFVMGILATIVFALINLESLWFFTPMALLFIAYFSIAIYFSFQACYKDERNKIINIILLPFIFLSMHLAYGVGTILGIIYIPLFLIKYRDYKTKWPVSDI